MKKILSVDYSFAKIVISGNRIFPFVVKKNKNRWRHNIYIEKYYLKEYVDFRIFLKDQNG